MIDQYHIERTLNLDRSFADDYNNVNTYPKFQEHLEKFKDHITGLVDSNESKTFYKFGDGDYHFLKKSSIGSEKPGNRAALFCFPYAGSGSSVFTSWRNNILSQVNVYAYQSPGKVDRFSEPLAKYWVKITSEAIKNILAAQHDVS